jgi:hypothetical protein
MIGRRVDGEIVGDTTGNFIGDTKHFVRFAGRGGAGIGISIKNGEAIFAGSYRSILFLLLEIAVPVFGQPFLVPKKLTKVHRGRDRRPIGISGSGGGIKLGYFLFNSSKISCLPREQLRSHSGEAWRRTMLKLGSSSISFKFGMMKSASSPSSRVFSPESQHVRTS